MGCYVRISKCRNRLPTIGAVTMFECSAWQLMRVQKSMIFNNIDISIGGKAISEMCKRVIFKNQCISSGGKAISEIAKTVIFINWLLSSGESTIFGFCKRSTVKQGYFPAGKVAQSHCLICTSESARRDVEA